MSNNKKSINKPYYMYKPSFDTLKERLNSSSSTTHALRDTFISGLGGGLGVSVADRVVSSVLGPRTVETTIVRSPDCENINKLYKEALDKNEISDILKEEYHKCSQS